MTTSNAPGTNEFPESSIEKKVYTIIESLNNYLPVANDRNRLAFNLVNYKKGMGDSPEISVKTSKLQIEGISSTELIKKIEDKLNEAFK